jgi:S1/P1 Nuclease
MRPLRLISTLLIANPTFAWNGTGHRIVAAIAYQQLTPETRAMVDDLLRKHPDYTVLSRNAPDDPAARARAVFLTAATWPDLIKGDPRFWDDTRTDSHPTAPLPGFPDMERHTNWHYYDSPFSPDHAHTEKPPRPSALTELPRMIKELPRESDAASAYDIVWIEHIVGDLHQPLHCVSRFVKSADKGDAGGNLVFVAPRGNLHSLWDGAAGSDLTDAYIAHYAADAMAHHPSPAHADENPKHWIAEGVELARTQVYTFGNQNGTRDQPIHLPDSYLENARQVAQAQVALAGYRLAAILNTRLERRQHEQRSIPSN